MAHINLNIGIALICTFFFLRPPTANKAPAASSNSLSNAATNKAGNKKTAKGGGKDTKQGNILSFFKKV